MRVKQRQVAVNTGAVTTLSQTVIIFAGLQQRTLSSYLFNVGFTRHQAIRNFLEGSLNGTFILRHLLVLDDFSVVEAGFQSSSAEDRYANTWSKTPVLGAAVKKPIQVAAGRTASTSQTDTREERGFGGTDTRVDCQQLVLSLKNIRTLI